MKQYLLILIALGALAPLEAMKGPGPQQPADSKAIVKASSKKASQGSFIENYVDMGDLIISIGRLYKRKKTDTGSITIALIEAIDFDKLPLTLQSGRETVVGEFFKGDELKACASEFLGRWFEGKLRKRHMADALEKLKDSLKMEAVKKEFGAQEWINIDKTFDKLIAYYGGEEAGEVEEAIDLEKVPALFGFVIKDYFLLNRLNDALNSSLKGEALTKSVLLDCLDMEQIALRKGYEEIPNADGMREAIELFFSMMEDDRETMFKVFDILGTYRATKNVVAEEEQPQVARPKQPARPAAKSPARPLPAKKDAARLKQEQDDAALAARLAREWGGQ